MAVIQLVIPDADRDRFVLQAKREGMTLSAWLCAAAYTRLEEHRHIKSFESLEDITAFFGMCDALEGPETEPDWDEHTPGLPPRPRATRDRARLG